MPRSLLVATAAAAVCGAAVLLTGSASVLVSVSGQATQQICDSYWSSVARCESRADTDNWSDARYNQCIDSARSTWPAAIYCPGPGLPPNNDRQTWRPPYGLSSGLSAAVDSVDSVEETNLVVDSDSNSDDEVGSIAKCMIECVATESKTIASECRTVKFVRRRGECHAKAAARAHATCNKKCAHKPKEVTSPTISTECSLNCQSKLTRCQKAAGIDGVARAGCVWPYNSCINGCMHQGVATEQAVSAPVDANIGGACRSKCMSSYLVAKEECAAHKAEDEPFAYNACVSKKQTALIACNHLCTRDDEEVPAEAQPEVKVSVAYLDQTCMKKCEYADNVCRGAASGSWSWIDYCKQSFDACQNKCPDESTQKKSVGAPMMSCERGCIDLAGQWESDANAATCGQMVGVTDRSKACYQWTWSQSQKVLEECQSCCSTIYSWTHECKVPSVPTVYPGAAVAVAPVASPAISTECSLNCQSKLTRCQKQAGTDGVARAGCVWPYNSCINDCMHQGVTAEEAISAQPEVALPVADPGETCMEQCEYADHACRVSSSGSPSSIAYCDQTLAVCETKCGDESSMAASLKEITSSVAVKSDVKDAACLASCDAAFGRCFPKCFVDPCVQGCQTVYDQCAAKCGPAPKHQQKAPAAKKEISSPAISTECSLNCQSKLTRCQKAAGTDGVARAGCVWPYNSCINDCMHQG